MLVYHGSNSRFDNLRVHKTLVKSSATLLNEGLGIYVSLDKSVAASYGKYLYTIDVDDNCLMDFRHLPVIRKYVKGIVKSMLKDTGVDITRYANLECVVNSVLCGQVAVSGICREIYLLLDSHEGWYCDVNNKTIEKVYKLLEKYDDAHLTAYLFNYNIPNIGVIKSLALKTEDAVKVVKREKIN